MSRRDLSHGPEWAASRPLLPNRPRGVPRVGNRRVMDDGIFFILCIGVPWRDLPKDCVRTLHDGLKPLEVCPEFAGPALRGQETRRSGPPKTDRFSREGHSAANPKTNPPNQRFPRFCQCLEGCCVQAKSPPETAGPHAEQAARGAAGRQPPGD